MYKTAKLMFEQLNPSCVIRTTDGACIPFDPANTDYAQFKKAVADGAELQDADGNVMSAEAAQDFIRTLP
jgi:hypothetical protein